MPDIEDMLGKVFFLLWDGREIRDMYRYFFGDSAPFAPMKKQTARPFVDYGTFAVSTNQAFYADRKRRSAYRTRLTIDIEDDRRIISDLEQTD